MNRGCYEAPSCDTDWNSSAESSDEEKIFMLPRETILTFGVEQFSEVVFQVSFMVANASASRQSPAVRPHLLMSTSLAPAEARTVYCTPAPEVEYIEPALPVCVAALAATVLSASRQPLMCLTIAGAEQFGCLEVLFDQRFSGKAANGFYGTSSMNTMKCDVAIRKDVCTSRCLHGCVNHASP